MKIIVIMFLKKPAIIFRFKTSMIIFALLLQNGLVFAKEPPPFDTMEIGLQYVANTNHNVFHHFYESGKGIEGFIEMPFYYGHIQGALQFLSYSTRERSKCQGFYGVFPNLKWGKQYELPQRVRWFTGVAVGLYAFLPNNQNWSELYEVAHSTETELCAGLNSHFCFPIHKNWAMRLEGSYHRIFTYKPIDLAYISIGFGISFAAPKWLKDFLE